VRTILIACALILGAGRARADTVLEGRIVGPDGKPVASAIVLGTFERDELQATFRSDRIAADGTFRIAGTPGPGPLRSIRVYATAPGFSNALELRSPPAGEPGYQPVVLQLRPPILLAVLAAEPVTGQPVGDATVTIAADSLSTDHPLKGKPQPVDATGMVVFRGVNDADTIELIARAPGRIEVRLRANFGYQRQHMRLARGGVLQARLLDTATSAAITGCRLHTAAGEVVTDAKGRFRITVAYGPTTVTPACADYGTDWDSRGISIDFAEATAGQVQTVTTRRNHYVTGTVTDAAGDVLPGVKVTRTFIPKGATEPRFVKRPPPGEVTTTDGNGDFVFQGSSMDNFELRIDDPKSWRQRFRYADLKGRIVIQLPR
jgi:hypothetical protein